MSSPLSPSSPYVPRSQGSESPYTAALSEAISSPLTLASEPGAGPSRPSPSRRIGSSGSRSTSFKRDWTPASASPGSKAATVSVEGTVQVKVGDKGVRLERGLSDLIIRSDRSPDKLPTPAMSTPPKSKRRPSESFQAEAAHGSEPGEGKGKGKKGWEESIVGGAVSAGVYGAALGVTVYKLWKQSTPSSSTHHPESTDPMNPVFPSFASPASPVHFEFPHRATSDADLVGAVAISAPSASDSALAKEPDIPPPPAYRERDHPSWEWTDEIDEDTLLTPSTSSATTLRLTPRISSGHHPHPLLHNTPSRSWGKMRRIRLDQAGPVKKEVLTYSQPDLLAIASMSKKDLPSAIDQDEDGIADKGPDEILDRLDDMTLRIQRLILQGQAALLRKNEDVEGEDIPRLPASRSMGKGSWGKGRTYNGMGRKGGGQVVRSRRSLPVVGVTRS